MEDIKELPDFDDVLSLYGKQKSDFAEEGGGNVDFVLSDSIGVKEKMKIFSASVLSAYNSGEEADPNTVVRDTECYRESLLDIGYGLVDESIPLFMTASKFFFTQKVYGGKKEAGVDFTLERRDSFPPVEIGTVRMIDSGSGFEVAHREVSPDYRGKKIGTMLLSAGDSFVKSAVEERGDIDITAKVGQLDVLYWFWNKGYRPDSPKDEALLLKVLNADGLNLKDRQFLFDDSLGDDIYFEGYDKTPKNIDYYRAVRLKLSKKFKMDNSAEIEEVQGSTSKQVTKSA